jgi:hypothetical protein
MWSRANDGLNRLITNEFGKPYHWQVFTREDKVAYGRAYSLADAVNEAEAVMIDLSLPQKPTPTQAEVIMPSSNQHNNETTGPRRARRTAAEKEGGDTPKP